MLAIMHLGGILIVTMALECNFSYMYHLTISPMAGCLIKGVEVTAGILKKSIVATTGSYS